MDPESEEVLAPEPPQVGRSADCESNEKGLQLPKTPSGPSTETILIWISLGATLAAAVMGLFGAKS